MKLDASLNKEERWEVARKLFDDVSARLERLEKEQMLVQAQLFDIRKVAIDLAKAITTRLNDIAVDNNAGSETKKQKE